MSSNGDIHFLKRGEVKQVKASSNALQKENLAVEKKLSALKEKMKKEKEERERMGGPRWKSSKKKICSTSDNKMMKKNIKVLSDQPIESYKQERKPPNASAKLCGQCDERKAKVECNECVESYCADCYKHFHSRGALRKHTWKSLEQIISVSGYSVSSVPTYPPPTTNPSVHQAESDGRKSTSVSVDNTAFPSSTSQLDSHNMSSLLHGEYNETESAASFSVALNEWRRAGRNVSPKQSERIGSATSTRGTGTDRVLRDHTDVKVVFSESPSISYLDRIIVRKLKKNSQDLTCAKYPTPTLERQITISNHQHKSTSPKGFSPKSVSPVQNIDEVTPSPCILSLHCTSPSKSLSKPSTIIEIQPCSNEDAERLPSDDVSPIVSYEGSDTEIKLTASYYGTVQSSDKRTVVHKNRINKEKELEHSKDNTGWKPHPVHVDMDKYFLLGNDDVEPTNHNHSESTNDITEEKKSSDLYHAYDKVWRPDSSIANTSSEPNTSNIDVKDSGIVCVQSSPRIQISSPQFKEVSPTLSLDNALIDERAMDVQFPDCIVAAPAVQSTSFLMTKGKTYDDYLLGSSDDEVYDIARERNEAVSPMTNPTNDFIQALPPLSKSDNHDKIHRSSTSLSISALPVDIWADSDVSLPVSRRSSNFCPSVTTSRKVSTNYEPLTEQDKTCESDTILSFSKLNLLAEEVIARRSEDGSANSADDDVDDCGAISSTTRNARYDRVTQNEMDNFTIEDNDAGSGLTTDESDG